MLTIPGAQYVGHEDVLWEMESKRRILFKIRKRQLKFLGHDICKDGLENSTLTGHIKGKKDKGKQPMTYLTSFCKSLADLGLRDSKKTNFTKSYKE